ncbi:MAG: hypothetical protein JAY74_28925 [Candidatus Thiodiazotropha taylori]|nr:hypothetical protein [Candidatus Thiodiazotropha taylori]
MLPINAFDINSRLVLDTGSAVTIISSNIYNKIPLEVRPPLRKVSPSVKLEVANDGLLHVLGEVTLDFKIQKDVFKWDVFIAPIREDGLLGLDFLQAHNYVLCANSGLKLNNKKYKTIIEKVSLRAIRILCKETVILPACSEMVIPGECAENFGKPKHGLVMPVCDSENTDYIVGRTLVDPSRSDIGIPVRLMNPTSADITIKSKTVLGIMQEADEVRPFICTSNQNKTENEQCESVTNDTQLPSHLQDLFKRSRKNLSSEQACELKELLIKHESVFAKSSSDLG